MQKIIFFFLLCSLLAGCVKREGEFYDNYGSHVSSGSVIYSNIRVVSLCTGPLIPNEMQSGSSYSSNSYVDHVTWDMMIRGYSMRTAGIGTNSVSTSLSYVFITSSTPANPIPGITYTLPDSLLLDGYHARININYINHWAILQKNFADSLVRQVDTTLENVPQDLYVFNNQFILLTQNTSNYPLSPVSTKGKTFPRAVSVSSPEKFKIRIINLSHTDPLDFNALPGHGTLSLCFASSQPVNASVTSGIGPGQASDYIELPCGTYQFRIFNERGLLVPYAGSGHTATVSPYINSTSDNFTGAMAFVPIRSYLPGGIYSLVVFDDVYNAGYEQCMQLITDKAAPSNITYSVMQWANALPGMDQVHLQIDGQDLQGPLDFGNYSAYQVFTTGEHSMSVLDSTNQTLYSKTFFLEAMNDYTLWAYQDQRGKAQVCVVANCMDFTNNGITKSSNFNFACRFANFCPDAPYVTFTTSATAGYGQLTNDINYIIPAVPYKVTENLPFGSPIPDTAYFMNSSPVSNSGNGYINNPFFPLYQLNAFVSHAYPKIIVPGEPIPGLLPLNLPFIINPAIYPNNIPPADAGVFTAALVGRINPSNPAENVRLMVIKHVQ